MSDQNEQDFLTVKQFAEARGIGVRQVRNYLKAGLPRIKTGPRLLLIPRRALWCDTSLWPKIQADLLKLK